MLSTYHNGKSTMFRLFVAIIMSTKIHYSVIAKNNEVVVKPLNYFESFFVNSHQYHQQPEENGDDFGRNAVRSISYKWPRAVVPYLFDDISFDSVDKKRILIAMELISNETCVQFLPKEAEQVEHIKFYKTEACGSYIGFRQNRTDPMMVMYSTFCLNLPGAIQHELLHVLGLLHEQSRPDRDEFVQIEWGNIKTEFIQNFMKADDEMAETFGLPYDYDSLMHYPAYAFAKSPGKVTMYAKDDPGRQLGQIDGPTFFDLEKIRRMYC